MISIALVLMSGAAGSAPSSVPTPLLASNSDNSTTRFRLISSGLDTTIAAPAPSEVVVGQSIDRVTQLRTGDTGARLGDFIPAQLTIDALAGHLSFDALQAQELDGGAGLIASNNALGVGMTTSWGLKLRRTAIIGPFASLSYNRVDSDLTPNVHSPRPYAPDNADTGFTGTIGLTATHQMNADHRVRLMAYGAMVAGAKNGSEARDSSSVVAKVVESIGERGPTALWSEVGAGVAFEPMAMSVIRASLVQTLGRPFGDAVSARIRFTVAL